MFYIGKLEIFEFGLSNFLRKISIYDHQHFLNYHWYLPYLPIFTGRGFTGYDTRESEIAFAKNLRHFRKIGNPKYEFLKNYA